MKKNIYFVCFLYKYKKKEDVEQKKNLILGKSKKNEQFHLVGLKQEESNFVYIYTNSCQI